MGEDPTLSRARLKKLSLFSRPTRASLLTRSKYSRRSTSIQLKLRFSMLVYHTQLHLTTLLVNSFLLFVFEILTNSNYLCAIAWFVSLCEFEIVESKRRSFLELILESIQCEKNINSCVLMLTKW